MRRGIAGADFNEQQLRLFGQQLRLQQVQGIGVVVCAPMLVEEEVRAGRLVALDPAPVDTEDYYWLLLPPGRVRPDAVLFSGWLLHEISLAAPG